ncbi:unnamed protein product, partial [Meganyctiphanes norvegica]
EGPSLDQQLLYLFWRSLKSSCSIRCYYCSDDIGNHVIPFDNLCVLHNYSNPEHIHDLDAYDCCYTQTWHSGGVYRGIARDMNGNCEDGECLETASSTKCFCDTDLCNNQLCDNCDP